MSDLLTERMNEKCFEVVIPEIYTKILPKYYTTSTTADLPRVNGVPVTMEEYMAQYKNFQPTDPFIPDLVYTPPEQNKATAMQSIADMIDMVDHDIEFAIANPFVNYPKILDILSTYCRALEKVAADPDRLRYLEKAREAGFVIEASYARYLKRRELVRTGLLINENLDAFDKIAKAFIQ